MEVSFLRLLARLHFDRPEGFSSVVKLEVSQWLRANWMLETGIKLATSALAPAISGNWGHQGKNKLQVELFCIVLTVRCIL